MEKNKFKSIAENIARYIFEIGDENNSPTKRIQFMGGDYPDNETNQGGVCEESLAMYIERMLHEELKGAEDA